MARRAAKEETTEPTVLDFSMALIGDTVRSINPESELNETQWKVVNRFPSQRLIKLSNVAVKEERQMNEFEFNQARFVLVR